MATATRDPWNAARYETGTAAGHYESWFQRANDPSGRRAFWIRYTIFAPRGRPADAVGELWAIAFQRSEVLEDTVGGRDSERTRELRARRGTVMLGDMGSDRFEDLELPRGELILHR